MKSLTRSIFLALTILWLGSLSIAFADDLPQAENVIEQYIKATGGRAAYEKIYSLQTSGTLEMPAIGVSMAVTVRAQAPDKLMSSMESDAIGKAANGTDGELCWENTMMTGPRILDGEEKAATLRDAAFNIWLRWEDFYTQATTIGVETVEEQQCHVVEMTPNEGQPEKYYFATNSGLLIKTEMVVNSDMGRITVDSFSTDYRDVDGVLMAFNTRQILMGMQEMIMKFDTVETNVDFPAETFEVPEEIQALMAKEPGEPVTE